MPTLMFCLLICCLVFAPVAAASAGRTTIELTSSQQQISINPTLYVHVDRTNAATLDTVLALPEDAWQFNSAATMNFGQSENPYWFRVSVTGLDRLQQRTFLQLDYPSLDHVEVFLVRDGQLLATYRAGDSIAFVERSIPHRTFLFPLRDTNGSSVDVYLKLTSGGPIQASMEIITESGLNAQDKTLNLWFGAYFGIMLMMLMYNALIFVFVRTASYFFYLLYISAILLLQFTLEGLSPLYLWPNRATLNNTMTLVFFLSMLASALAFAWYFIGLGEICTRIERRFIQVLYVGIAAAFLSMFVLQYATTLKLTHTLSFLAVSMGFYLGVKYWVAGVKAARIFALAWFVYLIFMLINISYIKGYIQPSFLAIHSLEIGSIIELVMLSLAFADRLNSEKELRLQTQIKLNEDLDRQVRERTEELELANRRLTEVSITDALTELYNRRHFDDIYANEYQRAFREKLPVSVVMIDLDHFKKINDSYGHPFGDLCLRQAAVVIRAAIKRPPDFAARYGGEEFVVLLPNTDATGARSVAEAIRLGLQNTDVSDGNHRINLSASIGVSSEIPAARDTQQKLLQRADENLYRAKHNGRNRVEADSVT